MDLQCGAKEGRRYDRLGIAMEGPGTDWNSTAKA